MEDNTFLSEEDHRKIFQFLQGAIGSFVKTATAGELIRFQFLQGAIGSVEITVNELVVEIFQFLQGAIGSERFKRLLGVDLIFQFLQGAIGSIIQIVNSTTVVYFNSFKVRLED